MTSTSRIRLPSRGGTLPLDEVRPTAQRLDNRVDLLTRRRHNRQPVRPSLLEIPFDEVRGPGTRITFSFPLREKRGLLDRVFSSSNPILIAHPADLAVREVDLEHVLRRADHTD
jgi:hypothetical protein